MQRDQKGAIAFLQIAEVLAYEFGIENARVSSLPPPNQTPFYVLASAVQEWLNSRKRLYPEMWQ